MRPASEVNSALELATSSLERMLEKFESIQAKPESEWTVDEVGFSASLVNVEILRDVLAWAMGGGVDLDGPNGWLCAFLLDDPAKLDDTDPRSN